MTADALFRERLKKIISPQLRADWRYVLWLTLPIEALDNRSPKDLTKSKNGRAKLRTYLAEAGIRI
jgi:hypothetical protein